MTGNVPHSRPSFSPFVCACFTVNYIVGTGFLTLPWAFVKGGVLLSSVCMIAVCIICNISSDFLLGAMARAECLTSFLDKKSPSMADIKRRDLKGSKSTLTTFNLDEDEEQSLISKSHHENATEMVFFTEGHTSSDTSLDSEENGQTPKNSPEKPLKGSEKVGKNNLDQTPLNSAEKPLKDSEKVGKNDLSDKYHYGSTIAIEVCSSDDEHSISEKLLVKERKFEMAELCQIFLGEWGFHTFNVSILLDMYGFLWAYGCVFGSALAGILPLGEGIDSYQFYVVVFGCIVIPMSFMELSEQAAIQVFLSGCRFVMFFIMVITPLVAAWFSYQSDDTTHFFGDEAALATESAADASLIRVSGVGQMIPVLVFSVIFHQSIPELAEGVADKKQLGKVFGMTITIIAVAYTSIGFIGAWYFGEYVESSSNLNWKSYRGFDGGWFASLISYYAVLFPAIDVVSGFPLNAFILGSSLMGVVYGDEANEKKKNPRLKKLFILVACVPPLIGAFLQRNLGLITAYSGLSGLAICFLFPALLYLASERHLKEMGLPSETHYERFGSSKAGGVVVAAFGALSIMYSFADLLILGEGAGI